MNGLIELQTCPSTSSWALARLAELPHGSVVFTRRQTAGRGREGRVWIAPEGTLTASIVVDAPPAHSAAIALAAGLAVVHAISDACPSIAGQLTVKWPNDVLLVGRKLAGILCEGGSQRLVIGIGLNRCAELPPDLPATSLHLHAEPPADLDLLEAIRAYLLEAVGLCQARGLEPLLPQLRDRDALLGRSVSVETRTGRIDGQGAGIDESGRLLVVVPGGGIAAIDGGHVTAWD